jgi:hypothetical protein
MKKATSHGKYETAIAPVVRDRTAKSTKLDQTSIDIDFCK